MSLTHWFDTISNVKQPFQHPPDFKVDSETRFGRRTRVHKKDSQRKKGLPSRLLNRTKGGTRVKDTRIGEMRNLKTKRKEEKEKIKFGLTSYISLEMVRGERSMKPFVCLYEKITS